MQSKTQNLIFIDNIIIYIENFKTTDKLLEIINELSKLVAYKVKF